MTLEAAAGLLACPVCAEELGLSEAAATCPGGHAFDVSRHGYLNLLRGPQPANADTAEMIAARGRFLASGAFDPILGAVRELVQDARTLAEAGAGTGWYLAGCLESSPQARGVATDVSIPAARQAARAHPRLAAVVADTWRGLPLRSEAVEFLLCAFAPRNPAEFARVLRPGARLVVVTPEPDHLAELRAAHDLLEVEPDKAERLAAGLGGRFEAADSVLVEESLDLNAGQVADVIAMGPNAFHAHPEIAVAPMRTTLSVRVSEWLAR